MYIYMYISICHLYNIPGLQVLLSNYLQRMSEKRWCKALVENPDIFEVATEILRCWG